MKRVVIDKDPLVAEPYLVTAHFTFLILHLDLSLKVCLLSFIRVFFSSRAQLDCSSLRTICDPRRFKPEYTSLNPRPSAKHSVDSTGVDPTNP